MSGALRDAVRAAVIAGGFVVLKARATTVSAEVKEWRSRGPRVRVIRPWRGDGA